MTTAALYVRVSTRQQADEGFSLEDQQRVLTDLATERGWNFRLYIDAGLSGERIDNRPALLDLLRATDEGQIDIVAVVDESRLSEMTSPQQSSETASSAPGSPLPPHRATGTSPTPPARSSPPYWEQPLPSNKTSAPQR